MTAIQPTMMSTSVWKLLLASADRRAWAGH
jgi:hypothetical protein